MRRRGTGGLFKLGGAERNSESPEPPAPAGELFPPARDSAYKRLLAGDDEGLENAAELTEGCSRAGEAAGVIKVFDTMAGDD